MKMRDLGRSGLSVLLVLVMLFTPLLQGNVQAAKTPDSVPVIVYEGNGMKIDFTIDSQWNDAFNATIKIENTGTQPIENWAVSFCFPHQITNIWNASIIETSENMYTIKNLGWNQDIPVGGSIDFGFTANASGVVTNPSQFFLNTSNQSVEKESFKAAFPSANLTEGKIISTPLNNQAHQVFTKLWRDALPYGTSYEIEDIITVAQDVYADYPVMLNAVNDWLRSLGATIP